VNEQIDEIEEMTSRQIDVLKKIVNEKKDKLTRVTSCHGRNQAGEGVHRHETQAERGRQDGGPYGNKGVIARILPDEEHAVP